jgi:hypothetical protein
VILTVDRADRPKPADYQGCGKPTLVQTECRLLKTARFEGKLARDRNFLIIGKSPDKNCINRHQKYGMKIRLNRELMRYDISVDLPLSEK